MTSGYTCFPDEPDRETEFNGVPGLGLEYTQEQDT